MILGRQLENSYVDYDVHDKEHVHFGKLTSAWNECVHIRHLEVDSCTIEHARAMMAVPKKNVKSLYISSCHEKRCKKF